LNIYEAMGEFRTLVKVGCASWGPKSYRRAMATVSRTYDLDPTTLPPTRELILTRAQEFVNWGMRKHFSERKQPNWVQWKAK